MWKKIILLWNLQSHFRSVGNNHIYSNRLFTRTGPGHAPAGSILALHMHLPHFHTWDVVQHQILCCQQCDREKLGTSCPRSLCWEKNDLSGIANANWHSLSRLHIPGDSVTIDRWWETREVGCSRGCTRGYLRHLVRKMSARAALTVQSLSPAH